MSLFDIFDAVYGDGLYQSIPDGIGGDDILKDGIVVDHMSPDGIFDSMGMDFNFPNIEGGIDVFSDGQIINHTQPNIMGGMDVYDGDMSLESMSIPNVFDGVDIFDADMNMNGLTMPNVFDGEDYLSMIDNVDMILEYEDPLAFSSDYEMDPFYVME